MSLIPNSDPPLLKQEKAFGTAIKVAAGVGAAIGLYFLMPYLLTLAFGVTQLAIVGVGLYAAWMLFTSDLLATVGAKMFRMTVRKMFRVFMSYDPVGALQDHIVYLRQCLGKFDEKRNSLAGIIENVKKQEEMSTKEYEVAMSMASKARDLGDVQQLNLQGRKAKRRKDTVENLRKMLSRLVPVLETLTKLRSEAQFMILDTEDEVNEMVVRHSSMTAAGMAMEEALKIIEGDPEMSAMFKDTMAQMELDIREKVGLIEMVMSNADGLIGGIDVKNATINEQVLRDLESWNGVALRSDKARSTESVVPATDTQSALRAAMGKTTQKIL